MRSCAVVAYRTRTRFGRLHGDGVDRDFGARSTDLRISRAEKHVRDRSVAVTALKVKERRTCTREPVTDKATQI